MIWEDKGYTLQRARELLLVLDSYPLVENHLYCFLMEVGTLRSRLQRYGDDPKIERYRRQIKTALKRINEDKTVISQNRHLAGQLEVRLKQKLL